MELETDNRRLVAVKNQVPSYVLVHVEEVDVRRGSHRQPLPVGAPGQHPRVVHLRPLEVTPVPFRRRESRFVRPPGRLPSCCPRYRNFTLHSGAPHRECRGFPCTSRGQAADNALAGPPAICGVWGWKSAAGTHFAAATVSTSFAVVELSDVQWGRELPSEQITVSSVEPQVLLVRSLGCRDRLRVRGRLIQSPHANPLTVTKDGEFEVIAQRRKTLRQELSCFPRPDGTNVGQFQATDRFIAQGVTGIFTEAVAVTNSWAALVIPSRLPDAVPAVRSIELRWPRMVSVEKLPFRVLFRRFGLVVRLTSQRDVASSVLQHA